MNVLVTYESMYGNTRRIADAIAEGLGGADVLALADAGEERVARADLLVVGGPTHMHGMPTALSRRIAAQAAQEDGDLALEPGAAEGPGLRHWLSERSGDGHAAAAFDTRLDRSPAIAGAAARGIARRLHHRGFDLVAHPVSFLVTDAEGPLVEGEIERARDWGASLAAELVTWSHAHEHVG